ncbi:PepSY-associated TM helix domain-containing protein [Pararhizobium polonicum]|uniref:PepSY-associated TM helix domain-containing protein n=1 Tax=Pararhizobium polonicum TaxID=1612624 RepID=A0A1C7PAS2_9HYPH|nr:PepSY domain-containing protein [Pararhizobium polonicum]OBZ96814.1 PepSY-associated TM helix domain-containing protein [Pararhizobium polonicum]
MSDFTIGRANAAVAVRSPSDLYRAVWRWHFYAGLLVLPFLVTLAITGALYLFRDEIDGLVHADLKRVEITENGAKATPSAMVAAALAAYPGTAVKFTDPASSDTSAEITVNTPASGKLAVYVNPYDGKVLGSLPDRGTIMWTIRTLHSLKYFGSFARSLIEIAAGWSILLVATGIYLWWPRRQTGGVLSIRGTPKRRVFWRDTHAVSGIFVGFFIVFLAVTGMPWSGVWGGKVNEWANGSNFGYPAGVRTAVPMSDEHLDHIAKTSWSLEQARVPQSSSGDGAAAIGLDGAVAVFDRLGLHRGYAVNIPATADGVYTGSVYPDDLAQQRVVHLDQYSGKPLIDMSYADYGPLGKALEWGINVHLGQQFGLANQLVLLAACIAIVLLAVSAGIMWWKRRPKGSLGVPPMPVDRRVFRGLIALLAIGGILFPLVGVSLAVMLALDWTYPRFRQAIRFAPPAADV